ncbi:hypothetical protein BOW53_13865 [Solemya pervernicosa gill symbiont]|uniref:STAS/SEC14 domain-containing protein n=2 Tax=Gammaproteobacteria incertae sedis TaxID=118884 RepID=A0A1T2L196_9GAMM|nr:hypothetical protein [Candidatus Reidiella endopervernicosa]OOZ38875.1 hypothetical protein BOW53_13865 [Solemya pervernicosa gill symbiont]QKQ25145.1 hypothetical protein HUE57_01715 [Candidatus Reidiella endopervernicosa]
MAVDVVVLDGGEGVVVVGTGVVTGSEILDVQKRVYGEETLHKQRYQIIDKSKCTEYNVSAFEIEALAELDKAAAKVNPNIVFAIIESESLQFSLTSLWQANVESVFKTESFKSRDDALAWIEKNAH